MERIVNALMLKAVDYQENDKILTLLTAEHGKMTVGIKGVKKGGAKLKFAAQPFCFAEYVLSQKGDKYTVINATENESFYNLRTDINKFYAASAVIEVAYLMTNENEESSEMFIECVKALSKMSKDGESEPLIEFLLNALKISGYAINLDTCATCGKSLIDESILGFDIESGTLNCKACKGTPTSRTTYNTLRKHSNKLYDQEAILPDGMHRTLKLLSARLSYLLPSPLHSLTAYLSL